MFGSWQLLSRTTNSASSEQAESLRFSLGVGDIVRFSRTAERRSVHHRVAPDLILFQIRPGPDLAGFGIADPAGAGAGAECS